MIQLLVLNILTQQVPAEKIVVSLTGCVHMFIWCSMHLYVLKAQPLKAKEGTWWDIKDVRVVLTHQTTAE